MKKSKLILTFMKDADFLKQNCKPINERCQKNNFYFLKKVSR